MEKIFKNFTTLVGKKKGIDKEVEAAQAEAEILAAAEEKNAEAEKNLVSENEFKAYLDGKVISLKEVGDGVFSEKMVGDGFEYFVKVGDVVKVCTLLLKFSKEKIKNAGHPDTAVFVVTNPNGIDFKFNSGMDGKTGETVIATC